MKKMLLTLIFLLFCGSVSAQDSPPPDKQKQEDPPPKEKTGDTTTEPSAEIWPETFNPSEKIGADSQISFPTDI